MNDKYLDCNEYLDYKIISEDETLDETINIQKILVEDVKECVKFLKDAYGDKYADKVFNLFLEVSLIHGVEYIQKNKQGILAIAKGD